MLQTFIFLASINLVVVGVYIATKNVLSSAKASALLITSLIASLFVYSGVLFAAIVSLMILRNGDDYSRDIKRIKEEEFDMYFHE